MKPVSSDCSVINTSSLYTDRRKLHKELCLQWYVKYLEIWIDGKLTLKEHVRETVQKAQEKTKG